MVRSSSFRDAGAATFADVDVARSYRARPPYPAALFKALLAEVPGRDRVLDIGCGPGNVAIPLADHFAEVVALDPSEAMLAVGREIDAGRHPNIAWTLGRAEAYDDEGGFDLVTAGASIHWPDHAALFPKLARRTRTLAIIVGDTPVVAPCGDERWLAFLKPWLERISQRTFGTVSPYDPAAFERELRRHEDWMEIAGQERFSFVFRQSLEDFITCQHSRATTSRVMLGEALAAEYDAQLRELMRPFVEDGLLALTIEAELTWGRPLAAPKR